jgi:hypothetical protein
MQQSCTYGSVRGALGQPASLPRQKAEDRLLTRAAQKNVAGLKALTEPRP